MNIFLTRRPDPDCECGQCFIWGNDVVARTRREAELIATVRGEEVIGTLDGILGLPDKYPEMCV